MCKSFLIALSFLLLTGCASDPTMRKMFKDGDRIFVDQRTGQMFLVSHHFGNNYTLGFIPGWVQDVEGQK